MTTPVEVGRAADVLRSGGLVAFPTETVYGLGADAANAAAIERLYAVKRRPHEHPVIVHLATAARLDDFAREIPPWARELARQCWPGPLTLVVRRRAGAVCDAVTGGRDTVALRVPAHRLALELLRAFGGGVAAPSANRFGRVSPTTADHVRNDLGDDVDMILDGGACAVGVESTIVDATADRPAILRLGAITVERVAELCGRAPELRISGEVSAPGTLASHYAPEARVELVAIGDVAARAAALLAREQRVGVLACERVDVPRDTVVLPRPSNADDYASVLYQRLREADEQHLDVLLVVPPDATGIGAAVTDRLRRAAAHER